MSSGLNIAMLGLVLRRILQHLLSYILKDVLCSQRKIVGAHKVMAWLVKRVYDRKLS